MRLCLKWLDGAGEGWAKACLDGELRLAPVPEVRPQGRRNRCDGASERRFCYYQGASIGAPSPLKKGGSTKSLNSRGGARTWSRGCLKCEFGNFARCLKHPAVVLAKAGTHTHRRQRCGRCQRLGNQFAKS